MARPNTIKNAISQKLRNVNGAKRVPNPERTPLSPINRKTAKLDAMVIVDCPRPRQPMGGFGYAMDYVRSAIIDDWGLVIKNIMVNSTGNVIRTEGMHFSFKQALSWVGINDVQILGGKILSTNDFVGPLSDHYSQPYVWAGSTYSVLDGANTVFAQTGSKMFGVMQSDLLNTLPIESPVPNLSYLTLNVAPIVTTGYNILFDAPEVNASVSGYTSFVSSINDAFNGTAHFMPTYWAGGPDLDPTEVIEHHQMLSIVGNPQLIHPKFNVSPTGVGTVGETWTPAAVYSYIKSGSVARHGIPIISVTLADFASVGSELHELFKLEL